MLGSSATKVPNPKKTQAFILKPLKSFEKRNQSPNGRPRATKNKRESIESPSKKPAIIVRRVKLSFPGCAITK